MRRAPALITLGLAAVLAGCGGPSAAPAGRPGTRGAGATTAGVPARPARLAPLHVRVRAAGHLPAPVQDPATTSDGGSGAVLFGGLDRADTSVATIVGVAGGRPRARASALPAALHDAAAATIGTTPYLFGGGNLGSSAVILRDGRRPAGALPVAASDVSAAVVGSTAYIVGGYDGKQPLDTIVAWRPGRRRATVVAHLPRVLRYATVAAVGGKVLIAGGTSGVTAQSAVLSFDPATRRVRRIGRLPFAVTHAAGAVLGGKLLVIGGRGSALNTQARAILAVDPRTGRTRAAGLLPRPLSDTGAATVGRRVIVAGGRDRGGRVRDEVLSLTVAPARAAARRAKAPARAPSATSATVPRAGRVPPPLSATNVYAADAKTGLSATVRGVPARVYVPNSQDGTVDVIDQRTRRVISHFAVGALPQHVTPSWDLRTLWVSNDLGNSLTAIDPRTGRKGRTVAVTDPYNLYSTPDGRRMIVVAEARERLDFRDPHTLRLRHSLPVNCKGVDHMDYTADGRFALASCEFSGQMVVVDLRRERIVRHVALKPGAMPQDVKLSPDGRRFFVADMAAGGVWVLDGHTFARRRFFKTGRGAHGLYVSRDASKLFVTNRGEGTISVLAADSGRRLRKWRLPGSASPDMGGVSADGRVLWLSGRYNAEVYAIDARSGRVLKRIKVGSGPHGLSVWPQPGRYSIGHTGIMR